MARMARMARESLAFVVLLLAWMLAGGVLALALLLAYITVTSGQVVIGYAILIPPLGAWAAALVIPVFAADIRAVRGIRRTRGLPADREPVPQDEAPRFREHVDEIAKTIGITAPAHIWLTPEANASVVESSPLFLRPWRRSRHLCIGIPLMIGLTTPQLRAVIAHELAHYARRHSSFGTAVYRGNSLLRVIRADLSEQAMPVSDMPTIDRALRTLAEVQFRLFSAYAALFQFFTLAIRRQQEYEADRLAARVVGPAVMSEALRTSDHVATKWATFPAAALTGLGSAATYDDIVATLTAPLPESDAPPARAKEWRQTHPSLPKRLTALSRYEACALRADPGVTAIHLIDEESALHRRVTSPEFLLPRPANDGGRRTSTWQSTWRRWTTTACAWLTFGAALAAVGSRLWPDLINVTVSLGFIYAAIGCVAVQCAPTRSERAQRRHAKQIRASGSAVHEPDDTHPAGEKPRWDGVGLVLAVSITGDLAVMILAVVSFTSATLLALGFRIALLAALVAAAFLTSAPDNPGHGALPRRLKRWTKISTAFLVAWCAISTISVGLIRHGITYVAVQELIIIAVAYPLFKPRARVGAVRIILAILIAYGVLGEATAAQRTSADAREHYRTSRANTYTTTRAWQPAGTSRPTSSSEHAATYLLTEQRGVSAAQTTEWPLLRATVLTEMLRPTGHGCSDQHLDTTESGHPAPNGAPASSSLPLFTSAAFGLRCSYDLPGLRQDPNLKVPIDCSENHRGQTLHYRSQMGSRRGQSRPHPAHRH